METDALPFNVDVLRQFCQDVLEACGVEESASALVAKSLTQADARGLASHGVIRLLPVYARRLLAGTTRPNPNIHVERSAGAVVRVDGDAGLGQLVGTRAMAAAMDVAGETGVAIATVRNSSHFGYGGMFAEQAVQAGMIGVALTNAPPNMPPWGGRSPYFGTNPLAIGLPCGNEYPVLLDMSTSVVARGKIVMAQKSGEDIPPGWAIDSDGNPTTDAAAALTGAVLPFGGYKGSGLALIIDALCGVLSGAAFGSHIVNLYDEGSQTQNLGHFFAALNIEAFMPMAQFRERMDQFVCEVRSQPRMQGTDRIYLPGELEYEREQLSLRTGIAMPVAGVQELDGLAESLGITSLSERSSSKTAADLH